MRPHVIFVSLVVLGLARSLAGAGPRAFIPRPLENGAYLDLFASYEEDDVRNQIQAFGWSDAFFREKLTLYSNGYFYHPRFLRYQLSLAGALKQEEYQASFLETAGWRGDTGGEYDGRLSFLPEHPYNLELFALRYEPLFKEQAATRHNSVETRHGAFFQYRKRPYTFHGRYSADGTRSGTASTDVTRLAVDGEYFKSYGNGNQLTLNAAYNPSEFTTSYGLEGSSDEYRLGNFINLRRVRLTSSVTRNSLDQESPSSGRFENDQFSWYELLTVFLPMNFWSNISYRHQENDSVIPGGGGPRERELSDTSRDLQLDVVHRLFQSLDTRYTLLDATRTSSAGDTDTTAQALNLSYTKAIPRGRILAGTSLGRGETRNEGRADVLNEPHPATPVPGSFVLGQGNVEAGSVAVFLKSPLAPFNNILLVEGVHYTLTPIGNGLEVDVFALPPQFAVPGTYDLFVSYSLATGTFGLGTWTFGFNASVELLEHLLTPYYSYAEIRTDEVSGVFPGIPIDSTSATMGLGLQRGPWRARGEYQKYHWEVSPYRAWRAEVQYVGPLDPTTTLYGTASYIDKHFPRGTTLQSGEPYTDRTTAATANLRKLFPSRNLTLAAGGSYSRLVGLVDTTAYAVNSAVTWKIGRLDLSAGLTAYRSQSQGAGEVLNDRTHQYYYVTLRRVLF